MFYSKKNRIFICVVLTIVMFILTMFICGKFIKNTKEEAKNQVKTSKEQSITNIVSEVSAQIPSTANSEEKITQQKKVAENQYKENFHNKARAFNEFAKAVDRMIAGEYLDTELEGKNISKEMLQYIHKNKTGALLKLCVRMGAILANASEKDIERLSGYADKIGLAFQIKDDILSEEGNEEILGKPVGNDKELEKCTYVSKYGLQGAKKILEEITKEAIEELKEYGDRAEFLRELALYIKDRNK